MQAESAIPARRRIFLHVLADPAVLVWVILAILVGCCAVASPLFLEPENLKNVFLVQSTGLGLATLAQAIVVLSGGIDLSVGAVLSLLTSLAAGLYRSHPGLHPLGVVVYLVALGAATGAVNGFVVVRMRVTPFMATLATMSLFQGAVLFYAPRTIGGIPRSYRFISDGTVAGVPFSILLFAVVLAACYTLLRENRLGRHIYAVGADPYVAGLSGISVRRTRFLAYLIAGVLVGIAASFMTARMGGGGPKVGVGYELDSITAVVIGGVSLAGGAGSLLGTYAGVLIIGVFYNLMNLLSVNAYLQIVLKGLVLVLAVSFYAKRRV
ncbi:MAG TPA: ABC transporter permease [Anaeromyxobacter sp.]|nr:ABC transporter permease [Anaeromyxobacter sp.]HVO18680.1 ABC transporter permease [Anaeromyxobacter sp.]